MNEKLKMFIAEKRELKSRIILEKRHPIKVYYLSSTGPLSIYATHYLAYISMRGSEGKKCFLKSIKKTYRMSTAKEEE